MDIGNEYTNEEETLDITNSKRSKVADLRDQERLMMKK